MTISKKTVSIRLLAPFERRYREVQRLREIAQILISNGLDVLLQQLDIVRYVPKRLLFGRQARMRPGVERMSMPERVRHTLEELGPTYVKLGQILAGRADLLPIAYLEELSKLLDQAPPEPSAVIIARVEQELGGKLDNFFSDFEPEPIAAASLAQVHRAVLKNGDVVAVKVRRTGILQIVEADIDLLRHQAVFLEKRLAIAREHRLVELVDELAFSLLAELDFELEARNASRIKNNLADLSFALIPCIYQEYSTGQVLVMQFLDGVRLSDKKRLQEEGYDLPAVARLGTQLYVQMIFKDGFFHADPHPGNIILIGQQIALVDFGTIGYLTPQIRQQLGQLVMAFLQQNPEHMTNILLEMGTVQDYSNIDGLERALGRILLRYYGLDLSNLNVGAVLTDVFSTAYEHHVQIPPDLALLAKTLIILDGVGLQLDPQFVMVDVMRPYLEKWLRQRFQAKQLASEVLEMAETTENFLRRLPRRADTMLDRIERGNYTVPLEIKDIANLGHRLTEVANQLSFALVVAALLISSAIILAAGAQAAVWSFPVFGIKVPIAALTFLGAGILGFWLLISLLRKPRK